MLPFNIFSPEILISNRISKSGRLYNEKTDVWAFGQLIYEVYSFNCCQSIPAFSNFLSMKQFYENEIFRNPNGSIGDYLNGVIFQSAIVDDIIRNSMKINPKDRFDFEIISKQFKILNQSKSISLP